MYEIIGKKNVDYFSKRAGKQVTGVTLYLTFADENIEGLGVKEVFISSKVGYQYTDFAVGSVVKIYYNEFGGIADIIFQ